MTSVLVVVPKKKVQTFKEVYESVLMNFYQSDFEAWKKRTRSQIELAHKSELDAKIKV